MATARLVKYKSKKGDIWRIRLDYVDQQTGERCRPYESLPLGTSKKQAEERMRLRLAEIGEAPASTNTQITTATLLVEWLERDVQHRLLPTTVSGYESTVRLHLIPQLGMIPIARLTPHLITKWQHDYVKNHGGRTVQLCHIRLTQALSYAVRMGYLGRNPCAGIRQVSHTAAVKEVWTSAECARFLTTAQDSPYHPIWHLLLGTGCRKGEALGLRWSDLDDTAGTITISRGVVALNGRAAIQRAKTRSSHRQVPIAPGLLELLRSHRDTQAERIRKLGPAYRDPQLIFATRVGTLIAPTCINRELRELISRAEVPRIPVHSLRHTAATLALNGGESIEVIRQLLGHKHISTTADIYARVQPPAAMKAAETIQRLLRNEDKG